MEAYLVLIVFIVLGLVYVGAALVLSKLAAPKGVEHPKRHQAVECGVEPVGDARIQFKVGYYLFALVFMVFDVEALFLFPALKSFAMRDGGNVSLAVIAVELLIFVGILFIGLLFAWRKKVLEWQ